jgi:hypothetical protein
MTDYQKEAKKTTSASLPPGLRLREVRGAGRRRESLGSPLWLSIIAPPTQGRWWRENPEGILLISSWRHKKSDFGSVCIFSD